MTTHAYRPLDVRLGGVPEGTDRFHRLRVPRRLVAVVVAAALGVLVVGGAVDADGPISTEAYVVQAGDTLWAIAAERTAPGDDVRDTMGAIAQASGLESMELAVGQRLEIPIGG